jgi:hypothetical protein
MSATDSFQTLTVCTIGGEPDAYIRRRDGLTIVPSLLLRDTALLSRLRHLDLSSNFISIIPGAIVDMKLLQVCELSTCTLVFAYSASRS